MVDKWMGAWMDGSLNPVKASSSLNKAATPLSSLLSNILLAGKEYILKDKLRERMRLQGGIECTFIAFLFQVMS